MSAWDACIPSPALNSEGEGLESLFCVSPLIKRQKRLPEDENPSRSFWIFIPVSCYWGTMELQDARKSNFSTNF